MKVLPKTKKETRYVKGKLAGEKSEATRQRILKAALTVFANHPFNAASMRMIGTAGGFDHAIIRYYFPSKAQLFETVMEEACMEINRANTEFFEGLGSIPVKEGFSLYIDRLLDYFENNHSPFKLIMQNMAQAETPDLIPGYQQIPKLFKRLRHTFITNALVSQAPEEDIARFQDSFNTLTITFLGAGSCQSQILSINDDSESYRKWVKGTLLYLFLPVLEGLIASHRMAAKQRRD